LAPRLPRPGGGQQPGGAGPGAAARPPLHSHSCPVLCGHGASPAPGGATDPGTRRGPDERRDRPGVSAPRGAGHAPTGLDADRERSSGGGYSTDPSGAGRLPGNGGDEGPTVLPGSARRGIRQGGADHRGAGGASRGAGGTGQERRALVGGRAVSAQGRTAAV